MIIFSGMSSFSAIKVGESFVVHLPRGKYKVNGAVIDVEAYNGDQITVDALDNIEGIVTPSRKELSHYIDVNGQKLTIEQHNRMVTDYGNKYLDEDGDLIDLTLEGELEHVKDKHLINSIKSVYVDVPSSVKPLSGEITLIGVMGDTGSNFIQTPFTEGLSSYNRGGGGVYKVLLSDIARDQFDKIAAQHPEHRYKKETHSNIRYWKINGEYVFTSNQCQYISKDSQTYICANLESAQKEELKVREFVTKSMKPFVAPQPISDIERKDIIKSLNVIMSTVGNIESKMKTQGSKNNAHKLIGELINKLGEC